MYLDAQTLLSDAQAFSSTAVSTNSYDMLNAAAGIDSGEPLCIAATVDVAADYTTTDETYRFDVIQSASANLGSATVLLSRTVSAAGGAASLLRAGARVVVPIPPEIITQRYVGLQMTLGGTTPSITLTAAILPLSFVQMDRYFADALTIS